MARRGGCALRGCAGNNRRACALRRRRVWRYAPSARASLLRRCAPCVAMGDGGALLRGVGAAGAALALACAFAAVPGGALQRLAFLRGSVVLLGSRTVGLAALLLFGAACAVAGAAAGAALAERCVTQALYRPTAADAPPRRAAAAFARARARLRRGCACARCVAAQVALR